MVSNLRFNAVNIQAPWNSVSSNNAHKPNSIRGLMKFRSADSAGRVLKLSHSRLLSGKLIGVDAAARERNGLSNFSPEHFFDYTFNWRKFRSTEN